MNIAFITVGYHSDEDTLNVVSQLEDCDLPQGVTVTTYCVDNSVSENLKDNLKKFKSAVYLPSPGNIGFAAGNNLGIKQALGDQTDLIVLINNDTVVPKDLVKNILNSPVLNESTGAVGGLIYFAKGYEFRSHYKDSDLGKVIWYAGGLHDWNNVYGSHLGVDEVDKGQFNGQRETDFITGCFFAVRPKILEAVGLFDERYCLYFEDSDLCLRIKKAGYKLIVDSKIKLWHKVAQSSAIGSPLNDYFLTRNRFLFGFTYASTRTKFALFREAIKKLFIGTPSQKIATRDFFFRKFGWGSWNSKVTVVEKK